MGIVTHQWRCRPVSLGQTCSGREKKKERRKGEEEGVEMVGKGGGVSEQGREEKRRGRNRGNKDTAACVVHLFSAKESICYTCILS